MGCCNHSSKVAVPEAKGRTQANKQHAEAQITVPTTLAEGVTAQPRASPTDFYEDTRDQYRLKNITFFGSQRRILLQSANGPCPLLALCNVLLLRNQMRISMDARYVSFAELVEIVGSKLFEMNENATSGGDDHVDVGVLNLRANTSAALEILPKLNAGLDVNCKFGGPTQFEYTSELGIFDLLDIGIYHGWVVGQANAAAHAAIAHLSYNQIVEKLIAFQENPESGEDGRLIKDFLDCTASQLSEDGLVALRQQVRERELGVFYRNGHFSTLVRNEGEVYLLCTDLGFAGSHIIWERLDNVNGNTTHCDSSFQANTVDSQDAEAIAAAMAAQEQLLAAEFGGEGLMPEADMLLAMQLLQGGGGDVGSWPMSTQPPGPLDADMSLAMQLMQQDLLQQEQQR